MIWKTPQAAFSALNPPCWLQQDMMLAVPLMRETKTLVAPTEALPQLDQIIDGLWVTDKESRKRLLPPIKGLLGCLTSNCRTDEYQTHDPIANIPILITEVVTPPSHAVIVVPSFEMSAAQFTSRSCFLPENLCASNPQINIARLTFWHEIGHLLQLQKPGERFSERDGEKLADFLAITLLEKKDPATAKYIEDFRLLSAFLMPLDADATHYWNCFYNSRTLSENFDEFGAQVELKTRAALFKLPQGIDRNSLVHAAFNSGCDPELSSAFNQLGTIGTAQKIGNLARLHHKAPYLLESSQQLATAVLGAAQRLVPRVLAI